MYATPTTARAFGRRCQRSEKNRRRCDLVDKKFATGLTAAEAAELDALTVGMRRYVDRVAPVPLDEVRRQHARLLEVAAAADPAA